MKYILSQRSHCVLERLARENTLCAFDFDGTLAPIASHPDRVNLRSATRKWLAKLASLYPCIIVSGRAREDVAGKLYGLPIHNVIGNHGAESGNAREPHALVKSWKEILRSKLASAPGIWIEDKGFSLAVHYRSSSQKAEARRWILEAAQALPHARVFGGKQVINIAPDNAPNKGNALVAEQDRLQCDWVLYVGDDENDEDAFAIGGNLISVRIGRRRHSIASYYLRAQKEIDLFLKILVRMREPARQDFSPSTAKPRDPR